jgi:hypothetical protein
MITSLVTEGFSAFQRVTTAASKEENAIVECANKEVNYHLRAFVFNYHLIVRIIDDTTYHQHDDSFRYRHCPCAQLVFASHADLDRGILFEWATPDEQCANNPPARTNAFVADLFRIQAQVLETALAEQLAQDAQHLAARQAAQIADPVEIREGDYVLLKYSDLGLGAVVPKIRTPRKGPFEVTQCVKFYTYRIRDLVSQRESEVNVSLLVPYHLHPLFATSLTVSEHEQEEWVVESVVDHEPHVIPRDKRHLRFRVCFRGLPDTHDRMYPWAQLASNPQLHAYLCANGLARLIPARFR